MPPEKREAPSSAPKAPGRGVVTQLRHLLAVDPGVATDRANCAWVYLERVGLAEWFSRRVGRLKNPDVLDCRRLMLELGVDWTFGHLVVEGQFYTDRSTGQFRKGQRQGYQHARWTDVQALIECRCAWQAAATVLGASTSTALPGTWIPAMTRQMPGSTSKARIKAAVRARMPGLPLVADEHDAALLGAWWVEEHGGRVVLGASTEGDHA